MAIAAHAGAVKAASTYGGSYTECDGIKNYTFSVNQADLDVTDFKDTSGAMKRIVGLTDISVSLDGDYEPSDTGQGIISTAFLAKSEMGIEILFDGTNGFKVPVYCTKMEIKAGVADTVTVSFEFASNGAVAAVP